MATVLVEGKSPRLENVEEYLFGTKTFWFDFGKDRVGLILSEEDLDKLMEELKKHKESKDEK